MIKASDLPTEPARPAFNSKTMASLKTTDFCRTCNKHTEEYLSMSEGEVVCYTCGITKDTHENHYSPLASLSAVLVSQITKLPPLTGLKWIYLKFTNDFDNQDNQNRYGSNKDVLFLEWLKGMPINIPLYTADDGMYELLTINSDTPEEEVLDDSIEFASAVLLKGLKKENIFETGGDNV